MKKAISVLLAVVLSVSQLALCAEAATNPLQASDRITQQLAETTARKQEIEAARIQRENMKDAAVEYGATSSDTNNLGFVLNRKTMTKREYEAFRWSFILSQYAIPLEDSLIDVFSQEYFNSMIEANIDYTAVQDFLTYGGTNPDDVDITASMLQSTNFNDVVDTIKSNYSLLYLYTEDNTGLTLSDLLYGSFAINEYLYIWDTILEVPGTDVEVYEFNSLYYQQERLADKNSLPSYNITQKKIPIAVYDAAFYFYLQLAVGTYCLRNSVTVADIESLYGTAPIVIDSYGNICIYTTEGAKVIMPNFGNSVFINEFYQDPNGKAVACSQIDLYNKWVVTLYSRSARTHVGAQTETTDVFGGFTPIALGGGSTVTFDDETLKYEADSQATAGQYIAELPVKDGSEDLSGTMLLVDPADITVAGGFISTALEDKFSENGDDHYRAFSPVHNDDYATYPFKDISDNLYTHIAKYLHGVFIFGSDEEVNTIERGVWIFKKDVSDEYKDMAYNTYIGTIYSNLTSVDSKTFFSHSLCTSSDEKFINPYPLINTGINIASMDIKSNSGKTHYYKAAASLRLGSWRYMINNSDGTRSVHTVFSGTDGANSSQQFLQAINSCLTMVTTFGEDMMVRDYRFASSRASKQQNGNEYSEIYLPISVINIGQWCKAFIGDEKGMFVAQHRNYFSGDMESFRDLMSLYLGGITYTATESSGGKVYDSGINFKSERKDKQAFIELQSSSSKSKENWWKWNRRSDNYDEGIIVAVPAPYGDEVAFSDCWTSEVIEFGDKYYHSFKDLNTYLKSVRRALGNVNKMYFSTSLCAGNDTIKDEDGKDKKDGKDPHNSKGNMRAASDGIKLELSYDSDNEKWTLTFFTYNGVNNAEYSLPGDAHKTYYLTKEEVTSGENSKYIWQFSDYKNEVTEDDDPVNLADDKFADENDFYQFQAMMNFIAMCGEANKRLESKADGSIASFKAELVGICDTWGFNADDVMYALAMLQHGAIEDNIENAAVDTYFFDEYQYMLRNRNIVSGVPGSSNSLDFSSIVYYWDRAYLPNLVFNLNMMDHVYNLLGAQDKDTPMLNSPYLRWRCYQDFLQANNATQIQYSFKQYLEDHYFNSGLDLPFTQELTLQTQSLSEFLEKNATIQQYFDFKTQVYNYLEPDTIIIYPAISEYTVDLWTPSGLSDTVVVYGDNSSEEVVKSKIMKKYYPIQVIMALQCNTDYEHNYLEVSPAKAVEAQHVTKEELMDKANEFFDNPVSSLSYIFAGFLYKAHTAVATGSLGSVFSATWLVESSIYKWIMARYVAIVTIAITLLLLAKLTQFAMSKTRDYWSIGRTVVGILAMCMVPLIVFNGFIWAFDATSQWALAGPTNKMLLSEVNASVLDRVNNDPGTTAEFNAFREQFDSIKGEYSGLTFEEIEDYSLSGPVYRQVSLTSYMTYLQYGTDKEAWFTDAGYVPVNMDHYDESMFYFFYDYIKAEFFNYITTHSGSSFPSSTYITVINENEPYLDSAFKGDARQEDAWKKINSAEIGLAQQTGEFIAMLEDTDFVYSYSINPQLSERYGEASAKDLVGLYLLFDKDINRGGDVSKLNAYQQVIQKSAWRQAINDADILKCEDGINPKLWTDESVINDFITEQTNLGKQRAFGNMPGLVATSKLDLFNSLFNSNSYWVDARKDNLALTPLEEKLCQVTTEIYEDTLKALEYHKAEIKNESAIQLMAWIATFKVSEAFGLEPAAPIPQTVTLDTIIRTAFIKNLDTISSNTNTMYSLVAQGDSVGKLLLVLLLETAIAIAGVLRIFIILYLTGATFVIFALRLLHKAPATTDLFYGIVGNVLALLALHALTLFLVVVSVEWVANATNNIPSLVLDLVMIAFCILMCVFLYRLVKNLVKDAVNLGGAKIKAGMHSIVSKLTNMITHSTGIDSLATQLQGTDVNLNADSVAEQAKQQEQVAEEQAQRNRERVERITGTLDDIQAEEEELLAKNEMDAKVARNRSMEAQMSDPMYRNLFIPEETPDTPESLPKKQR